MKQLEHSEYLFGVEAVDSCEGFDIRPVGSGAPMSENGSPPDSPAYDGGVQETKLFFPPHNNNDTQDMEYGKSPPSEQLYRGPEYRGPRVDHNTAQGNRRPPARLADVGRHHLDYRLEPS